MPEEPGTNSLASLGSVSFSVKWDWHPVQGTGEGAEEMSAKCIHQALACSPELKVFIKWREKNRQPWRRWLPQSSPWLLVLRPEHLLSLCPTFEPHLPVPQKPGQSQNPEKLCPGVSTPPTHTLGYPDVLKKWPIVSSFPALHPVPWTSCPLQRPYPRREHALLLPFAGRLTKGFK